MASAGRAFCWNGGSNNKQSYYFLCGFVTPIKNLAPHKQGSVKKTFRKIV